MTTLSKSLLAVSVTGLVAGSVINFGGFNLNPAWTVALPFGAVFYGLFLISFMLEKEVAKFDEEEAEELRSIQASYVAPARKQKPVTQPIIIPLPSEKFGH
ncbi:MAG: hypothetical protein ABSG87_09595 [Verrucomicrobiota bacterium]|jgi:hypothetical protein